MLDPGFSRLRDMEEGGLDREEFFPARITPGYDRSTTLPLGFRM
jgi:hypothetical protein